MDGTTIIEIVSLGLGGGGIFGLIIGLTERRYSFSIDLHLVACDVFNI